MAGGWLEDGAAGQQLGTRTTEGFSKPSSWTSGPRGRRFCPFPSTALVPHLSLLGFLIFEPQDKLVLLLRHRP